MTSTWLWPLIFWFVLGVVVGAAWITAATKPEHPSAKLGRVIRRSGILYKHYKDLLP